MTERTHSRHDLTDLHDFGARARQIRRLARTVIADEHQADDLASQLVLHEMRRPDQPREPRSRGWLVRSIRNLASKHARGEARRQRRESAAASQGPGPVVGSASEAVQHAETLAHVTKAALELREPYRSTILLRYLQERSVDEVADLMQVPASTVRVRTKRAIEQLRGLLERSLGKGYTALLVGFAWPGSTAAAAVAVAGASSTAASSSAPSSVLRPLLEGNRMNHFATLATATAVSVLSIGLAFDLFSHGDVPTTGVGHASDVASEPLLLPGDAAEPSESRRTFAAAMVSAVVEAGAADQAQQATHPPLQVRVVDNHGQPVAGATVAAYDQPLTGSSRAREGVRLSSPSTGVTDAQGIVELAGTHPFAHWGILATAPGFADLATTLRSDSDDNQIVMHRATQLTGRVTESETGAPLGGVLVRASSVEVHGGRVLRGRSVTTDASGAYSIDGLPAESRTRIEFARPGMSSCFVSLDLPADQAGQYDIALRSGAQLTILAIDDATQQPIQDAAVYRSGFGVDQLGTTDATGRLSVTLVDAAGPTAESWPLEASPMFSVEAAGYAATVARAPKVGQGEVGTLEMRMVRGGTVRGTVRDAAGQPVEGADVAWFAPPLMFVEPRSSGVAPRGSRVTATAPDGTFEFVDVPAGNRVVEGSIRVLHNGQSTLVRNAIPAAAGATKVVDVVLGAGLDVSGLAVLNGNPVEAWVYFESTGAPTWKTSTTTTEDGVWSIYGLSAGTYQVHAVTANGATARSTPMTVEVLNQDLTDVRVEIVAAQGTIRGRALYDDGTPASGRSILAFKTGEVETAPTDPIHSPDDTVLAGPEGSGMVGGLIDSVAKVRPDGTFEMMLPANIEARYLLGIYGGGFGVMRGNARTGMNDVEFLLPKLGKVRVQVGDAQTGAPLAKANVRWEHPASGRAVRLAWRRSMDTLAGVLSLELPVGTVQLTVRDPDSGRETTVEVTVPGSGAAPTVEVDV